MKTLHLHMTLTVPDHAAAKAAEVSVLDLKRALRIFALVKGVSADIEEEEVVILDTPKPKKRRQGRDTTASGL